MYAKYQSLKIVLTSLTRELVDLIQKRWSGDWSQQAPKVGLHFNYWDVERLPTYEDTITELRKISALKNKYGDQYVHKPIGPFLEAVIYSIPEPSLLDRAIEYWWNPFVQFIEASDVPVRLLVGLSNFKAERIEYRLDSETVIHFYEGRSLEDALTESVHVPPSEPFMHTRSPLHMIPGAIQVDFMMPANEGTLVYSDDTHECIKRMIIISNALYLSTFGRLEVGPWLPICNPDFPIKGVRIIESSEGGRRMNEPIFYLDDAAWDRFVRIYLVLKRLQDENEQDIETGRASRRRIESAISQFVRTFEQGYWELVIVNLVILMESLLTPDRGGGKMQLAIAASNLLGGLDYLTKSEVPEAKEVFDIVQKMYELRNQYSHGEPITEDEWDKRILEIAKIIDSSLTTLDNGVREYTFEIMRDYARRAICAILHLYNGSPQRVINKQLMRDFHRMHLDQSICNSIVSDAHCYPLSTRPAVT